MCGIVGAASSNLSSGEISLFEDLMIVSNLRGKQGSGIITVTNRKDVHSTKVLGSGIDAIESSAYLKRRSDPIVNVLIGHTRWPTKGGVDINAVHPHAFKNVIGVHNGTLHKVENRYVQAKESDSYLLYKHISEVGPKEAINNAKGAYALVFIDYKKKTLNFIRNCERTLWFAKVNWTHFGKTVYWASEKGMLELVLNRAGVKNYVLEALPVDELWSLPAPMQGNCDFEKESGIYQDVNGFRPQVYSGHNHQTWQRPAFLERPVGSATVSHLPSPSEAAFGKETFVWRDGRMVAKADATKQVFLPRSVQGDEAKGEEKNDAPLAQTSAQRILDQQRQAAVVEVQSGVAASDGVGPEFSELVRNLLSREEVDFDDDLSDFYQDNELPPVDDSPWEDMLDAVLDEDTSVSASTEDAEGHRPTSEASPAADYETMVETLRGCWISRAERLQLLREGCIWTGDPCDEQDTVHWVNKRDFVSEQALQDKDCLLDLAMHYPRCQLVEDWKAGLLKGIDPPRETYFDNNGNFHPTVQ